VTTKRIKAPVRSAWSWAGFYRRHQRLRLGHSNSDTVFSDVASTSQVLATSSSNRLNGAIGGAQAGYNWVAGNLIAGSRPT
jgi:hypothetical protein